MGEAEDFGYVVYNQYNSGGSYISKKEDDSEEIVKIKSFKQFCDEEGILANDIDYIWIDTEGYEASIIEGAKDVLEKSHIPLLQEYNPTSYLENAEFERYCSTMKKLYSSFVDVDEYIERKDTNKDVSYPIESLREWTTNMKKVQADLFFF